MKRIEYDNELRIISNEFQNKKSNLAIKYALSNNKHKIGDIVTDHWQTIKIGKISVYFPHCSEYPECVYQGQRYTKAGKPFKSGEESKMYQENIKTDS